MGWIGKYCSECSEKGIEEGVKEDIMWAMNCKRWDKNDRARHFLFDDDDSYTRTTVDGGESLEHPWHLIECQSLNSLITRLLRHKDDLSKSTPS